MRRTILFICFLLFAITLYAQRKVVLLDRDWKFIKADPPHAVLLNYDDRAWETVAVPHDWAIKGPFDKMIDAQTVTVSEDGEKKSALRVGRTGSLPWTGIGWYRKKFFIPNTERDQSVFIEFDGAMSHAVVYLNGDSVGTWPYGYSSFSFDLSNKIVFGKENLLAVRLENMEESSRWYPGAGIYRNVRLVLTNPVHVKHWGSYIVTPSVSKMQATVRIATEISDQNRQAAKVRLVTLIVDPGGKVLQTLTSVFRLKKDTTVAQQSTVINPHLWDTQTPSLYKAITKIFSGSQLIDQYETPFGIRSISFDSNKGFLLNGIPTKINGVCNHHDLGPLGIAINYRALERQLQLLKEMGCNAIRTSHNPPAPELLDLCDRMGFIVMDEAFDEWKIPKCKNGYNKLFAQWAEKDLRSMIKRDRNHPCVVLWSIGNEVPEQGNKDGAKTAKFLVDIVHSEDPTRLTVSGFNSIDNAIKNGLAGVVDVVGVNYRTYRYQQLHAQHPEWRLLGSETNSTISSRGEYMFPVIQRKNYRYANNQCSSYDMEMPGWGNAPDVEFALQDDYDFVSGEFVWTGFDYLGEPTPYNNNWPSHSSYFGIIDLAGIPKDRYYLYQSQWSDKKVLHLLPHWNWKGREGEITPVYCYTSYSSAELFVNGKSQGVQRKDTSLYGRYRLRWDSVRYEPGEIKVVAYDNNGRKADVVTERTAGDPFRLELLADRTMIKAGGNDLSFVTVRVLDKNGNICPVADNNIFFNVGGAGSIRGVANGDPTNIQSLAGHEMKAFNGQCVVVIQSAEHSGIIKLTASSAGLQKATISLRGLKI